VVCVYCLSLPTDRCVYAGAAEARRRVTWQHVFEATTYSLLEAATVETAVADGETFKNNAYVGMQTEDLMVSSQIIIAKVEQQPTELEETHTRSKGNEFPWMIVLCVAGGVFVLCMMALVLIRSKWQSTRSRSSRVLMELQSTSICSEGETPEGYGDVIMDEGHTTGGVGAWHTKGGVGIRGSTF